MVRTVKKKYQVWLAGYYDDFNGARAIGDFTAKPSDTTTYTHLSSHFGNPLNGEAFLNPRYRWSAEERQQDSNAGNKVSTTANNMLQNDGIFEWLTFDDTRLTSDKWEGRIHLNYPDGHVANRYKFNNDSAYGSDFYQRFINGHNSDASYIVPVGDNDASFGRSDMKRYDSTNYEAKNAGKTSTTGNFVQRAHLTGSWMGEQVEQTSFSDTIPAKLFAEVTSPSKQPFLCVQTVRKHIDNDSPDVPAIIYDGPLNSRLDGDVFTTRIAVRSHIASGAGVWDDIKVKFEIGFPIAQAGLLNDEGYTGAAAITQSLDLKTFTGASGSTSYDVQGLLTSGNSWSYTNDDSWLDVDFVFDYTNSQYDWYVNGIKQNTSPESMSGSPTAAGIYGYQLSIESDESDGNYGYVSYLMLDRAGLVRYLSDDMTSSSEVQIHKMQIKQANNGISSCSIALHDDAALSSGSRGKAATDYLLNLRGLFVSSAPLDWNLLVFGDKDKRIDRPVWKGAVDSFAINQKGRSRELVLRAVDSMEALNNQIPLWDVGQKAQNETGDSTTYWDFDAQGFRDAMYLGGGKLKLLNNNVGFDKDNSYLETSTQRTQLGSGHPIQMYNNENTNTGPNDIEDGYEGVGILGFTEKRIADTNGSTETNTKTIAILATSSHGLSASDTISIQNTNNHNDTTVTIESVSNAEITIDNSQLVYTPESAHIVYAGAYGIHEGVLPYMNDDGTFNDNPTVYSNGTVSLIGWEDFYTDNPTSSYYQNTGPYRLNFIFDADPNLKVGDYLYMNRRDKDHQLSGTTYYGLYEARHKVKKVVKFRNYFNIVNGVSQLTGNPTVLWAVETYSPVAINTDYGDVTSDTGLLTGDSRYQWSKDTGQTSGHYTTNTQKSQYRAIHARWMRDLPQSLWFKYHFGKVEENPVNNSLTQQHMTNQSFGKTSTSVIITQDTYDNIPDSGVVEIWTNPATGSQVYQEKFVYQAKSFVGGSYRLIGCKYINNSYTVSSNNYILKVQNISDDYKHLWLLWSDMRNNGKANADGSTRKQKFGLQYPLSENYDFDLFYVDQFDAEGNIDKFASLKVGDDLRVWDLDVTNDPITGGAFSKPADLANKVSISALSDNSGKLRISTSDTGSVDAEDYIHLVNTASHDGIHKVTAVAANTHFDVDTTFVSTTINTGNGFYCTTTGSDKDLSTYQDWEDKAGSMIVIDSSPFFNLNTHVNGGKTGQTSGGSSDLSDYVATRNGFPSLIDNYWSEAMASYQTTEELLEHPNQDKLISDAQLSPEGLIKYDVGVTVEDAAKYDDSGVGILKIVMETNGNEDGVTEHFFSWENKLETQYDSSGNNNTPTNITWEGVSATVIVNSGETHLTSGLKPGMLIKRTTSGGTTTRHTILRLGDNSNTGDETGLNPQTTLIVTRKAGDMINGTEVTWATTDSYSVPVQLGMVRAITANTFTGDASWKGLTLEEREEKIYEALNLNTVNWDVVGLRAIPSYTTDTSLETTPKRFEVHATITSSFMLRLMMHVDGFYENTNGGTYWNHDKMRFLWNASIMDTWLPSAKIPSVFDINNVPVTSLMTTYNDTSSNDSYGSIVDSRGKSLGSTLKQMREKTGFGTTNSSATTFSVLVGRDNRIEFRPKYNSGISFDRDNMLISKMSAKLAGQITNVRVYYNNNQAFVDYPATDLTDSTRWKILEHPKITSSKEALIVAQKQYNTYSDNSLSMEVSPLMPSGDQDKMIDTGRYGYIADSYIGLQGNNDTVANVTNWTYIGTGGALFQGMVNALNGNMSTDVDPIEDRYGISQETGTGDITWNNNYYWYGSNSISHAVQIVHIPNDVPLVSDTTTRHLRIWVDLKSTQESDATIDTAEFTVHIADYNFSTTLEHTASSPSNNTSSKDVKHSGYYQIDIPQSYSSAQGKIVFSFNAEYCRALLRHRCGNPEGANILTNYNTNADSIFPLGMRPYTEMGGGFRNQRKEWYAPKILICRDLSYVPATYLQVTDLGLEMNNETMVIQEVDWNVSAGSIDDVKLRLERDESLSSQRLLDYILNQDNDGLQLGTGNGGSVQNPPIDWGSIGITPPSNLPSQDTNPNTDQSLNDAFTDTTDGYETGGGVTVNRMSKKSYGNFKGRMDLTNDNLSGDATFSVLGQQKPSITPATMRGIEGMDVQITPVSGTASRIADGYVFAGKGLQGTDFSIDSQEVSLETHFIVPNDILSNKMSIQATTTHAPSTPVGGKNAVLYVTVFNEQAGTETTSEVKIPTGVSNRVVDIMPEQPVSGLNKGGNKIRVIITRKPTIGDDNADTTSVVIKNLNVKMQRASAHTSSSASKFTASLS